MSKIVLVTGASRGIGLEAAKHFSKEGYKVIGTSRGDFNLGELIGDDRAISVKLDLMSKESIKNLFVDLKSKDLLPAVLVNNAGITKDNLLMRMSEEDFDTVMEVNMKSIFNLTKAILRPMLKQRSGSIINMSSVVGVKGNAGQANYSASKAGIIGFSKSTALELGSRNIRCNVIAPGFIETEMTAKLDENIVKGWTDSIPLKRGGTPEDIANATVFLASDMSAYISGQVLNVCGGMLT